MTPLLRPVGKFLGVDMSLEHAAAKEPIAAGRRKRRRASSVAEAGRARVCREHGQGSSDRGGAAHQVFEERGGQGRRAGGRPRRCGGRRQHGCGAGARAGAAASWHRASR